MTIVINGTTGISGVDGSAGTPAVQGTDTNTGVFYPAADTVGVSTGGSERVRVDSSGNVGIGTSSPATKLNVVGSVSASDSTTATKRLQLDIGASSGTINCANYGSDMMDLNIQGENLIFNTGLIGVAERMRIDSSGNVGIGTASPIALRTVNLEVSSSGTNDSAALIVNKRGTGIATARLATVGGANGFDINYNFPNSGMLSFYDLAAATTRVAIDSSGNLLFNSGYGSVATAYGCRAWVNFNGTGVVAIRASGNVTSITDNGVGDYTVNFTTAMPDTNYSVGGTASVGAVSETSLWWQIITGSSNTALSTTSVRINTPSIATLAVRDTQQAHVQIFR